jgi:hypothetical protein
MIGNDSDFGLDIPNAYQPNNYLQQVKFQIIKLLKKKMKWMPIQPHANT